MNPTSILFFIFVAISLVVYYIAPKKLQWVVLLIASLFFMGYASRFTMLYMVATSVLVYFCALYIDKQNKVFIDKKKELSKEDRKKLKKSLRKKQYSILSLAVVICVAVLAALRYVNFFGDIINGITGIFVHKGFIPVIKFAVPLGISYYTLMTISYIVDVYRGTVKAEKSFFKFLLFVCYFPHITEGPFDTYDKLSSQFVKPHSFNYDTFMNAGSLLLLGLVKKMVLADRLAYVANEVFDNYESYSGIPIVIGMLAYTIQIYFDFSGCIDIVRGVSKMFDIEIAENFNRPFFSRSVQEFWRRWHITLGLWLKNYIFYPVSLSKLQKSINQKTKSNGWNSIVAVLFPLLGVWLTMGIWHGASYKYVVYGLYYFAIIFLGIIFEPIFVRLFEKSKINRNGKIMEIIKIIRTDILIIIGLTLFRVDSVNQFAIMIKSSIGINIGQILKIMNNCTDIHKLDYLLMVLLIIAFFIFELLEEKGKDIRSSTISNVNKRWLWITGSIVLVMLLGVYGSGYTEQPFVYAGF